MVLCEETVAKLRRADAYNKRRHDAQGVFTGEFHPGDFVLIKNRVKGSLETKLTGPYEFVKYKDYDRYACVLKDDKGKEFDCSVEHLVPMEKRVTRRRV